MSTERFFQAGGSLAANVPSYIARQADQDLYSHLKAGDFCYVLTARQMGKSSLKVKVMQQLSAEGWVNVGIDLTAFGSKDFSTSQWYYSFLYEIAYALDLDEIFETWWAIKQNLTPVARMSAFWEEVLLSNCPQKIAIYIDEIDTMLSLDKNHFSTDDFFAAVRATYNRRGTHPELNRLNFCIFGVATPQDLMSDHERTPFNIGLAIKLDNFTEKNIATLLAGFQASPEVAKALLKRILYWTNGQPYLTQKLCQVFSASSIAIDEVNSAVDEQVNAQFLQGNILDRDTHFSNIQSRILDNKQYNLRMLELYRDLVQKHSIPLDNRSTEQLYLKLAGIAIEEKSSLEINNRIYRAAFDSAWLRKIYESIERPLSVDLDRWLALERSPDALLKGQLLANAEEWANKRKDLTQEELAFLNASKLEALRSEQEFLRQKESNKQQKRLRWALVVAVAIALWAIGTSYRARLSQEGLTKITNLFCAFRIQEVANDLREQDVNISILLLELSKKYHDNALIQKAINELRQRGNFYEIFKGHKASISSVAFSPDGKSILTGSRDSTARLWDIVRGKSKKFDGFHSEILSVAFSSDGKRILVGYRDTTAILWDGVSGKELKRFIANSYKVLEPLEKESTKYKPTFWSVTFSPDGKSILTGLGDKTARLWDVQSGKELKRFEGHMEAVLSVTFSPDGKSILTGSSDKTARLWGKVSGKELRRFSGHQDAVLSVAFSPDGKSILTGSEDKTARLWDGVSGKERRRFSGNQSAVNSVAFSPDAKSILTGSRNGTTILCDKVSGKELKRIRGHQSAVNSVAFSRDAKRILTGSSDKTARLWNVDGKERKWFGGHLDAVNSVAFSPDNKSILTGSWDNMAILWDKVSGKELLRFSGHQYAVLSIAFAPDGKSILTGSWDNIAILWDKVSGKERQRFSGHLDAVNSVAFSPDNKSILTGSRDKTAILWDKVSGKELQRFNGHTDAVLSVAFSPDGKRILTGSEDKTVILWDVKSGKELKRFSGHSDAVWSVAFAFDGKSILTGSGDKMAILWDVKSGRELQRFSGHKYTVLSVAFSPDGKSILTGSSDRTAILWDKLSGKELQRFSGHTDVVLSVAFSPDGKSILTGSSDRTAILWDKSGK